MWFNGNDEKYEKEFAFSFRSKEILPYKKYFRSLFKVICKCNKQCNKEAIGRSSLVVSLSSKTLILHCTYDILQSRRP